MIKVLDDVLYADDIYLIIKTKTDCLYVLLSEGTGDNLLKEDIEAGYVDYAMYDFGHFENDEFIREDGGMLLRKKLIAEEPEKLLSVAKDFLKTEINDYEDVYIIKA